MFENITPYAVNVILGTVAGSQSNDTPLQQGADKAAIPARARLTFKDNASSDFKNDLLEDYERIPENIREAPPEDNLTIAGAPFLGHLFPNQTAPFLPSQTDSRYSINQIQGTYVPDINQISLAEYYYNCSIIPPNVMPINASALDQAAETERYSREFLESARKMDGLINGTVDETLLQERRVIRTPPEELARVLDHEYGHHIFWKYDIWKDKSFEALFLEDMRKIGGNDGAANIGMTGLVQENDIATENEIFADTFAGNLLKDETSRIVQTKFVNTDYWVKYFLEDFDSYRNLSQYGDVNAYYLKYPRPESGTIAHSFNCTEGTVFVREHDAVFSMTGPGFVVRSNEHKGVIDIISDKSGILSIRGEDLSYETTDPDIVSIYAEDKGHTLLISHGALANKSQSAEYASYLNGAFPQRLSFFEPRPAQTILNGTFRSFGDLSDTSHALSRMPMSERRTETGLGTMFIDEKNNALSIRNDNVSISTDHREGIVGLIDDHDASTLRIHGNNLNVGLGNRATLPIDIADARKDIIVHYGPLSSAAETKALNTGGEGRFIDPLALSPLGHSSMIADVFWTFSLNHLGFCPSLRLAFFTISGLLILAEYRENFIGVHKDYIESKIEPLWNSAKGTFARANHCLKIARGSVKIAKRGSTLAFSFKPKPENTRLLKKQGGPLFSQFKRRSP